MPVATRLSIEEFEAMPPPQDCRYELDEGELVALMFPTPFHNVVLNRLLNRLTNFVESRGLGIVFPSDTGFVLSRDPGTLRGPDISFIRQERARSIDLLRNIPDAPDLAIEIRSPSESRPYMQRKVRQYLAAGAVAVWVIHPEQRSAEVCASGATQPMLLSKDDSLECQELLPGFSVRVGDLFPDFVS